MKPIALAFGLLAAVLGAIAINGAPQQLVSAGITAIIAIGFWRAG